MQQEISLSLSQFRSAWTDMVSAVPDSVIHTAPGIDILFSRLPIPFFNVGILNGEISSVAGLTSLAQAALEETGVWQVPWFLVLTQENLPAGTDASAALEALGLVPLVNLTGMIAGEVAPREMLPESLSLDLPDSDDACTALLSINQEAYNMDLQAATASLGSASFWKGRFPVVGKLNGTPVSCSAVLPVDGHHYVAFVATRPGFERRGYADATMRHALSVARQTLGKRDTFLHATDAGLPVYERMGFTAVAHHCCYIEKKYLAGH